MTGQSNLSSSYVIDLHCDTPMLLRNSSYDLGVRNTYGQVDIPRMREGGINAVFFSVYTSASRNTELESVQEALEIIDLIYKQVTRFPEDLMLALSSQDIEKAKQHNKIAILIGVEGGHMLNSSLAVLRNLYRLGSRYLTLTHSKDTPWAGSSGSSDNTGLSDLGRQIVAAMNMLGMLVDVSHVSDQTFQDVIETTAVPIIASHSSVRAIASHARNLTDEMIRMVADQGGVVHINYYNAFLDDSYKERSSKWREDNPSTPTTGMNPDEIIQVRAKRSTAKLAAIGRTPFDVLLNHFEHVVNIGGIESVGLGSDFDGVDDELPEGMEDISKIPNLLEGLSGRGFSNSDIEKILGGNSLRVLKAVESSANTDSSASV